jgi:hypothetical protein
MMNKSKVIIIIITLVGRGHREAKDFECPEKQWQTGLTSCFRLELE